MAGAFKPGYQADAAYLDRLHVGNLGNIADGADIQVLLPLGFFSRLCPRLRTDAAGQSQQKHADYPEPTVHGSSPQSANYETWRTGNKNWRGYCQGRNEAIWYQVTRRVRVLLGMQHCHTLHFRPK